MNHSNDLPMLIGVILLAGKILKTANGLRKKLMTKMSIPSTTRKMMNTGFDS